VIGNNAIRGRSQTISPAAAPTGHKSPAAHTHTHTHTHYYLLTTIAYIHSGDDNLLKPIDGVSSAGRGDGRGTPQQSVVYSTSPCAYSTLTRDYIIHNIAHSVPRVGVYFLCVWHKSRYRTIYIFIMI